MIGYLKGNVVSFGDGTVILENNGIGFEVFCSASVYNKLVADGYGEAYIYTALREDDISLYGFIDREEKEMFLRLISVSGVGPKMGIAILSQINLKTLSLAIATADVKLLSGVKGLGKKTAEKIIVELKDKMEDYDFGASSQAAKTVLRVEDEDAVNALLSLGFTKQESVNAVRTAKENGATSVNEIIAGALKVIR